MTIDYDIAKRYAFHRQHGGGIVGENALWALRAARAEQLLDEAIDLGVAEIAWEWDDVGYADDYNPRGKGFEEADAEYARAQFESNAWTGPFYCVLTVDGEVTSSVGGVVLDSRGTDDPYARVLIADLTLDSVEQLRQAIGDKLDAEQPSLL